MIFFFKVDYFKKKSQIGVQNKRTFFSYKINSNIDLIVKETEKEKENNIIFINKDLLCSKLQTETTKVGVIKMEIRKLLEKSKLGKPLFLY